MEWIESLINQYGKLRLAREARDLDDSHKLLATDREVVRAHHRRNLGEHFRERGDDDTMIHIGDQHQHIVAPAPRATGLGTLAKLAAAAALLGTGLGGGIAATMFLDALRSRPAPPVISSPDGNTRYELRLGRPE